MASGFTNTIINKALGGITAGLVSGLNSAAKYAGAGQRANAVSAGAQKAAAAFNQASTDNANAINQANLANQYGYNSAAWSEAAQWNENMFNQSMQFNAEEAQKNRDWQEKMDSTKYQRAIKDMKSAGLNPVLAVTGNGVSVGSGGGGASASVSAPTMGAYSGGLLGANDASISGYTGQMEYYAGLMGLLGSAMNGISSALAAFGNMPSDMIKSVADLLGKTEVKGNQERYQEDWRDFVNPYSYEYNYKNRWEGYWNRTKGKTTR